MNFKWGHLVGTKAVVALDLDCVELSAARGGMGALAALDIIVVV
jgi:hypothetical protein